MSRKVRAGATVVLLQLRVAAEDLDEHSQPATPDAAVVGRRHRRLRPRRQRRRHRVGQPACRRLRRTLVGGQPPPRHRRRPACLPVGRALARRARTGRDLHAGRRRARADCAAGRDRLPCRRRPQQWHGRRRRRRRQPAPGHARRRAAPHAAHPRPQLCRPAGAFTRPERQLRAGGGAAGPARLRRPVRRPGHCRTRLGERKAYRLFLLRVAGRRQRRRLRRPARLPGGRRRHRRHPAVCGKRAAGEKVHVGSARRRPRQADTGRQGRPQPGSFARRLQPHRRAGRRRPCGRRRAAARRHVASEHHRRVVRRRQPAGTCEIRGARKRPAPGHSHQRRRPRGDGHRRHGGRRRHARRTGHRHDRTIGRRPAGELVARQPGRHHRRCPRRALHGCLAHPAGGARGRRRAADSCAHCHRRQRRHRGGAATADRGQRASRVLLLDGRRQRGGGARAVRPHRRGLVCHPGSGRQRPSATVRLSPQSATADAGAGRQRGGGAGPRRRARPDRCAADRTGGRRRHQGLAGPVRHPGGRHPAGGRWTRCHRGGARDRLPGGPETGVARCHP